MKTTDTTFLKQTAEWRCQQLYLDCSTGGRCCQVRCGLCQQVHAQPGRWSEMALGSLPTPPCMLSTWKTTPLDHQGTKHNTGVHAKYRWRIQCFFSRVHAQPERWSEMALGSLPTPPCMLSTWKTTPLDHQGTKRNTGVHAKYRWRIRCFFWLSSMRLCKPLFMWWCHRVSMTYLLLLL